MDKTRFSRRRLIENELTLRRQNRAGKEAIKKLFKGGNRAKDLPIPFYCECSDEDCESKIEMSIADFEKHHTRKDRFVVLEGHDMPELEQVVKNHNDYLVVQKFDLPR